MDYINFLMYSADKHTKVQKNIFQY